MKARMVLIISLMGITAFLLGAVAIDPCGKFSCSGKPHTRHGVNIALKFLFGPKECDATCSCKSIAYIQIARVMGRDGQPQFELPGTDLLHVQDDSDLWANGWAVDQELFDSKWGFYGLQNTGQFNSAMLSPGSDDEEAVLRDGPKGWTKDLMVDYVQFVSVPVCMDSAAQTPCGDKLLGYYYWDFVIAEDGTITGPSHELGTKSDQVAVEKAITAWNSAVPSFREIYEIEKKTFPNPTSLAQ